MKANKQELVTTSLRLQKAVDHLNVAYWTQDDFHVKVARESLVRALGFEDESDMYDNLVYGCNNTEEMMEKLLQRFM
mgnify:CR=1 FL=1